MERDRETETHIHDKKQGGGWRERVRGERRKRREGEEGWDISESLPLANIWLNYPLNLAFLSAYTKLVDARIPRFAHSYF